MNPIFPDQKISFCLSSQGNSISLMKTNDGRLIKVDIENDDIHPKLKEAVTLKTHYAILKFLIDIQSNDQCLNSIELYRHSDPTSLNYSVARFTQSMLGLPKLVIDPCPIMEMIDFVKSQVNILNLESVEEINEYLNDNIPEAEWSLIGTLNLKFEGCTITLNNLIKLFYEMINDPNQHNNLNSCNALLKKINSFYNDLKEKSKQSNFITLTLMQKNIINVDTILKEIKSNLEKRMNTNERLEELV